MLLFSSSSGTINFMELVCMTSFILLGITYGKATNVNHYSDEVVSFFVN